MGGLLTLPSFTTLFPEIDSAHPPPGWSGSKTAAVQGITVGGYTLGCFFGACATIWLGNWLGRKRTIFVGTSIMIVGALLQCTSYSIGQLIPARLITGFGNGSVPRRSRAVHFFLHNVTMALNGFTAQDEHLDRADVAIGDVQVTPQGPDGHD